MPDLSYMELNLMQMLDVLRAASLTRLAVSERDQPYVVPLHYQLEVTRGQVIIHLTMPEGGRKAETLRRNALVCLEFELPGCAWVDTVILEGRAAVGLRESGRAADIRVAAAAMTGRRYFVPPESPRLAICPAGRYNRRHEGGDPLCLSGLPVRRMRPPSPRFTATTPATP